MGCRVRLIARAARVNGALDIAVEPLLLPAWHLLASVEEEYNAVYLRCASSGDLSLFGKGAGALPAATAVLGDLIDLAQDNSVRWPAPHALPVAQANTAHVPPPRRHYLRVIGQSHPGLERRIESLVQTARPCRAESRVARRGRSSVSRLHDLAKLRRAHRGGSRHRRAARPRREMLVSGRAGVSGVNAWLDPAGCPGRTAAADARCREAHASSARRA